MAGDWIEWSKGLAKKREVVLLASKLRRDRHEVAGRLMVLWEWCDDNLASEAFDDEENASLKLWDKCPEDGHSFLDSILGIAGFADALAAQDVGWLIVGDDGSVVFPKLGRHNGETSKQRAYDRKRKREYRKAGGKCPEVVPENLGLEKRGARGEKNLHSREEPIGADQSPPIVQSRMNGSVEKGRERDFPLPAELDWGTVMAWAIAAGQRVPPRTNEDRRAWLRYAVIAAIRLSEGWLIGAAEQARVADTKKTRQSHFVAVLKATAKELDPNLDAETFNGIAGRIEIPSAVWKSNILFVEKKR